MSHQKDPSQPDEQLLLSIPQTARRLDVSRWLVNQLIDRGELRTVNIGARKLVPVVELQRYVARLCKESGIEP